MKTQITKLIILASLFLTACKPQNLMESYIGEYIEFMADGYANYYCDYPNSLDELLSLYQIDTSWIELTNSDTIRTALSFLEKEKNAITWQYSHPTYKTFILAAFYYDDTLFYRTGEWFPPYLYGKIHFYVKKHLEYPKSINDFLRFDSIICGGLKNNNLDCWNVTLEYLLDNRDKLEWIVDDDMLLIKSFQDTVLYENGKASDVRCYAVPGENNTNVFTNIHGKYDYREETKKDFQAGLRIVRENFLNKNQCVKSPIYMVEYRSGVGLSRFCENEEFPLDTKWFNEVEKYASQFAKERELERILFYTPSYEIK